MALHGFEGKEPRVADDAFVAPTATVIGDVVLEARTSVWFGAVLRGDFNSIVVGEGSCVQDNCVVHCADALPTLIGRDVLVGHAALLEGCVIEDGALIGMGAIVLQRARIGNGSMIAAGSVVAEGAEIPPRVLAAGAPARVKKELTGSSQSWVANAATEYSRLRGRYLEEAKTKGEAFEW
jgi:carbonic anhydrase/acetyltransferase-like protein (isoleucine patch superfamily)